MVHAGGRPRMETFTTFLWCDKCKERTGRSENKNGIKNGKQQWRMTCTQCERERTYLKNAKKRANK